MQELDDTITIIKKYDFEQSNVIQILSEVQEKKEYLPREDLNLISEKLKLPLSKIYGIITFYHFFRLDPPAKTRIHVCVGTACHVRGSKINSEEIKKRLDIEFGENTADNKFSLEEVACVGSCSLAPVLLVNNEVHAKQDLRKLKKLMDSLGVPEHE